MVYKDQKMINTYIIHYPKLLERKKYLDKVCTNPIWCSYVSRETLDQNTIKKYYCNNPLLWYTRVKELYKEEPPFREMKAGDLSCSINHIMAWKDFIDNDKNNLGLFFEDDIILCENFYTQLNTILYNSPNFDILFIGGGFPHTVAPTISSEYIDGFEFIVKNHPATNCLCSYILTKNTAQHMYNFIIENKTVLPIDFEVNYILKLLDTKVIHLNPMLCIEGSVAGIYNSTQSR
jgi:GR25 family glycosyltransferase involved in LPS biosynthesis